MSDLSHTDSTGRVRMVDVGSKSQTARVARAEGVITMSLQTLELIRTGALKKGELLGTARLAGIMAAKKTSDLIPLCHPLELTDVSVDIALDESIPGVRVTATTSSIGRTGVEMEALTAVTVSLLTVYDMAKAAQKDMIIGSVRLLSKTGGKSGDWSAG